MEEESRVRCPAPGIHDQTPAPPADPRGPHEETVDLGEGEGERVESVLRGRGDEDVGTGGVGGREAGALVVYV
jgi:hypothetical protein